MIDCVYLFFYHYSKKISQLAYTSKEDERCGSNMQLYPTPGIYSLDKLTCCHSKYVRVTKYVTECGAA